MNTILALLLFILPITVFAQDFQIISGASYGVEIDSKYNLTTTSGSFELQPQYSFDKLKVSLIAQTVLRESSTELPQFLTGTQAGYQVWSKEDRKLDISGRFLIGSAGTQVLGGAVDYGIGSTTAGISADWDYRVRKTVRISLNLKYSIIN